MTAADDACASDWFVSIEDLASEAGLAADEVRWLMLTNRLPLPSYIRSDGCQMVPRDLLELPWRAGGFERLPGWFGGQFDDPGKAVEEWENYISGRYVCLRDVTPENMKRKDHVVAAIEEALALTVPQSAEWRNRLQFLVDELDELEPPFTPYDRLRFGGPVTRDRLIDAVRDAFPKPAVPWPTREGHVDRHAPP
jgi:hypothetical protein